MWASQGVPPHVLKEWAGHTNITTTMNIYVHVNESDPHIEAIIERLYGGDEMGVAQSLFQRRDDYPTTGVAAIS